MSKDDEDLIFVQPKDVALGAEHWIELYDSEFARMGLALHRRPLNAALLLLNEGIKDVPGQSKDQPWEQPWFAEMVGSIREWYEKQYGEEALKAKKSCFSALVMLRGTPIHLQISETVKRVQVENELSWMIYPDAMHESESILSFFSSKPNLDSLKRTTRTKLEEKIGSIVRQTRRINLALKSASGLTDEGKRLRDSIWVHVDSAITYICTLNSALISVAAWELHLAIEKTFKVFLLQRGHTDLKIYGHDISRLVVAAKAECLIVTRAKVAKLPHWKKAADGRYGDNPMEISEAIAIYDAALGVMSDIAEKINRVAILNNAGFLLKKPKWV